MLLEEMGKHLPEEPQPEMFEAWYHSNVTQWFIQNQQAANQLILEAMQELDTGSTDGDMVTFYRLQGASRNIEEMLNDFSKRVKGAQADV